MAMWADDMTAGWRCQPNIFQILAREGALASRGFPRVMAPDARGSPSKAPVDMRQLIREIGAANPLWGPPRTTANCSS
jgi:hypothetical protein